MADVLLLSKAAEEAMNDPFNPFPSAKNCNMAQLLFLTAMYGMVLFQASNLISDGSELLLLVPKYAGIVGSVVLPILGAVPDGVMVLFSGLGADAQNQVSVGVGALAGSTVMLLTLPWFLAVLAGRVNLKDGKATYVRPEGEDPLTWEKLSPPGSMHPTGTGIQYGSDIIENAKFMLFTLAGYVVIQGAAFCVDSKKPEDLGQAELIADQHRESHFESYYALVGFFVCMVGFGYYLKAQMSSGKDGTEKTIEAIKMGQMTLRGAMADFRNMSWTGDMKQRQLEEVLVNKEHMDEVRRMCKVLGPFFGKYDLNGDGTMDFEEFRMIFQDLGENISRDLQFQMFNAADANKSGDISFEEFVACLMSFALDPNTDLQEKRTKTCNPDQYTDGLKKDGDDDVEEAEEEDMPEDLADLEPEEQQRRIKQRSVYQMSLGTLLVLIFSDPMVDLLSEIGIRLEVSAFYIAFVLAPLASNASELVAAYNYAKKRTSKSITTSLSTLEGAAVMNNTFCLAIFLGLVYFKHLAWEFTAETISIVFIQVVIAFMVLTKEVHRLLDAYIILGLYPLALFIVYFLENYLGWD
eukprot:TRINITY_DN62930_c0_g1_i1.p1 TRINITY_DN62930_c0_g1~~TRINITY_DN62930_c0_g1_i1.p1  ORF type:complete len:579 (-),score=158.07 TRINITY_DN62930_c0_g1_i1:74-1810(-)